MRRSAVRWVGVLALAVAGVLALGTSPAFAKSYEMTRVWIDATVAPDGSMTVVEERTYDFTGDYTFAFWELDKGGADGLEVLGMAGPEGEYTKTSDSGIDPNRTPQTYTVVDYGSYYDVRAYFRAEDVEHTLTLRYKVYGAATRWQDTAELYWKFIGERWDLPAEDIRVHITLPGGVGREDVRAWAHGPLAGEVVLNDDGTVDLLLADLPALTFVEARVLFPAEALSGRLWCHRRCCRQCSTRKVRGHVRPTATASWPAWSSGARCCSRGSCRRWRSSSRSCTGASTARSTTRSSRGSTSAICRRTCAPPRCPRS
jgi:hypothetical protein